MNENPIPTSHLSTETEAKIRAKTEAGVKTVLMFNEEQCEEIERRIDEMCEDADRGRLRTATVDRAHLRNKWVISTL